VKTKVGRKASIKTRECNAIDLIKINLFSNCSRLVVVFHEPLHRGVHGFVKRSEFEVRKVFAQLGVVRRLLELPISLLRSNLQVRRVN
jgi:hypothetical protein